MSDNGCDGISVHSTSASLTSPLRVITQYSDVDVRKMQSPTRPTSLGVCPIGAKTVSNFKPNSESLSSAQDWQSKIADSTDIEKLLGQLGTSGSTPVTPTSFLNPRNITEDQEMFADNFSRTLNKLQAEHEGWLPMARVADSPTSESFLSRSQLVSYLKSYSSPPIIPDVTTSRLAPVVVVVNVNTEQNGVQSAQSDRLPSRLPSLPQSPKATSVALTSVGTTAYSSSIGSTDPDRIPPASAVSATLSTRPQPTWSTSAQKSRNVMVDSTEHSSLPTILTIATSLKEACIDQTLKPDPSQYNPGEFAGLVQDNRDLSSFFQGTSTFLPTIPHLLETDRPTAVLRYTLSDSVTNPGESRDANVFASGACVSSAEPTSKHHTASGSVSAVARNRQDHRDFYTIMNPKSQSTDAELSAELGNEISTASCVAPVALIVGTGSSATPRLCHTDIGQGNVTRLGSPVTSTFCSQHSMSSFGSTEDMNSLQPLHSNSQLHPLTAIYSVGDGSFTITTPSRTSNHLMAESTPFLVQPNMSVNGSVLNFIPNLTSLTSLAPTSLHNANTIVDMYTMNTMQSGDRVSQNGGANHVDSSSSFLTGTPTVNDKRLVLSNSGGHMTPLDGAQAATHFPTSLSTVSRKNKRSTGSSVQNPPSNPTHSTSVLASNETTVVCADSSTDVATAYNALVESGLLRPGSKRPHDSSPPFATPDRNAGSTERYLDANTSGVYLGESHRSVSIKQEPMHAELLDSASNHSDPYSTDTGLNLQSTTPCSLDSVDLKLERKRARNRVAARRCRERKLSLIRALENQVAERDAIVKSLEETLARYRAESERLRAHVELLANSYPSLKAELCQFSMLFHNNLSDAEVAKTMRPSVPAHSQLSELNNKHFPQTH